MSNPDRDAILSILSAKPMSTERFIQAAHLRGLSDTRLWGMMQILEREGLIRSVPLTSGAVWRG